MKTFFTFLFILSPSLMAAHFECTLWARLDLMHAHEVTKQVFNTEKMGMDMKSKGFTFKVRSTLVEGVDHIALQLQRDSASAATMGPETQQMLYVNLYSDPAFAIAECNRK